MPDMLREIVLDTETTGTDWKAGDRLIEIGAVELLNHIPTGLTHHVYVNPGRPVSQAPSRSTACPTRSSPTSPASRRSPTPSSPSWVARAS